MNSQQENLRNRLAVITDSIKLLVKNNPLLLSPYSDSQAIDIALTLHLLIQNSSHDEFASFWLKQMINRVIDAHEADGMYPCNFSTYQELLEHRNRDRGNHKYKKRVTLASILYPVLALFSGLYKEKAYIKLEDLTSKELPHCTMQYWYPTESTESYLYTNAAAHGAASMSFPLNANEAIKHVLAEITGSNYYWSLSVVKAMHAPLVLVACRHFRYPMPLRPVLWFSRRFKV